MPTLWSRPEKTDLLAERVVAAARSLAGQLAERPAGRRRVGGATAVSVCGLLPHGREDEAIGGASVHPVQDVCRGGGGGGAWLGDSGEAATIQPDFLFSFSFLPLTDV